ncbi:MULTISPECIES: hypothetical protein [unclassified Microcoleus]|uniref:hypothetical protein n=1 Tax=unclassified Microcoleus TaxID=2642155 RepID=UPI001DC64EA1|nr:MULTISPECIES: hypothetical protein [unclassified Microcoleus]MCC3442750.1 hypothetical protein [Microcoleus sp. PH2017_03_ELD_O_A]MCC3468486.1 hypothetical protein [Microcoleus sp. PH2017_06_SFM_O_A]MCC3503730.1 hypothetical protein [Microcoleus sp. PH2017_19_SFW_U_A]TAE44595.1 MAG: hypothetical protein EAZ90_05275 [Oscillatoriales cyanobacterium]MCC3412459.1 hypothetical protein [Microcoleus sp. PH2017_02_FOX_O_A]
MSTPVKTSPILTLEEIFSLYPDEWVLIVNPELDEELSVIRGEVLAHAIERDEIHSKLSLRNGKSVAIEYTGLIPDNLVMIL